MEILFYNVTSIRGFTSMITVVYENNRTIWLFPTVSKRAPVWILRFILITLINEQKPLKLVRVDKNSALENSTDVTNLLIGEFKTSMETTCGYAYYLKRKNERHNRSIHNMLRVGLLDSNKHGLKWCCAAETSAEVHRCRIHNDIDNISPYFAWYGKKPSIYELRKFGCDIYPITSYPKSFYDRTQEGSFVGYTNIRATVKWWYPHTKRLKYCSSEDFDIHKNKFVKGCSPGS